LLSAGQGGEGRGVLSDGAGKDRDGGGNGVPDERTGTAPDSADPKTKYNHALREEVSFCRGGLSRERSGAKKPAA